MKRLSETEAYTALDDTDLQVINHELQSLFDQAKDAGKVMVYQYFLEDEKTITLEVYWDGEKVETYRFSKNNLESIHG